MDHKIEICHIAPTSYIEEVADHNRHLVLAHLVESNPLYVQKYLKIKQNNPNAVFIMDNSGFELFKSGKPYYTTKRLIELAERIHADYIVIPDYPTQRYTKTISQARKTAPIIKKAGFKTFFVPQSKLGDIDGWVESVKWGIMNTELVDLIGISIIAAPTALGLEESKYEDIEKDDYVVDQKTRLERFYSRRELFKELQKRNVFDGAMIEQRLTANNGLFHFLGAVDGYKELKQISPWARYIASWDTSSAVWHGIYHIRYDDSITGLKNGKLEKEVNFNYEYDDRVIDDIKYNIQCWDENATF